MKSVTPKLLVVGALTCSMLLLPSCGEKDNLPASSAVYGTGLSGGLAVPLPGDSSLAFSLNGEDPTFTDDNLGDNQNSIDYGSLLNPPDASDGINVSEPFALPDDTSNVEDIEDSGVEIGNTQVTPEESDGTENYPTHTATKPTQDIKYPNTGMFPEDD